MMPRNLAWIALIPILTGCPWIGAKLEAERLDPDGDGVPWPEDCDDDDKKVSTKVTFYADGDNDGFGNPDATKNACKAPNGYVDNPDDCDDTDPALGLPRTFLIDADRDGFGNLAETLVDCFPPDDGWVLETPELDCNDGEPLMNPGMAEICNDGMDNNCDESVNQCTFEGQTFSIHEPLPHGKRRYEGSDWSQFGGSGAIADWNDDGALDLLVGAPGDGGFPNVSGAAYVIEGPFTPGPVLSGPAESVRALWSDQSAWDAGYSSAFAGDVGGLGQTVLVGSPTGSEFTGYWGGSLAVYADPSIAYPSTVIYSNAAYQRVGDNVIALGDVNNDGHDDFAYTASYPPQAGVWIMHGPMYTGYFAHGSHPWGLWVATAHQSSPLGFGMALGDTDGDGATELYAGDPRRDGGWVWQIDPAATGNVMVEDLPGVGYPDWDGTTGTDFGQSLVTADVTGDGIDDLIVGVPDKRDGGFTYIGGVLVYAGGPGGALEDPIPQRLDGDVDHLGLGFVVGSAGDANQDGFEDVLLMWEGAWPNYGDGGGVMLVYGGPVGTFGDRVAVFHGLNIWDERAILQGDLDMNGDGINDLVIGEGTTEMHGEGAVTVIFGQGF